MTSKFDYFIVFAEMRTGSNFLESNLNDLSGVRCHGEAFNPYFVGGPKKKDLFGVTMALREEDPLRLIDALKENTKGLPGFRFFHDHDPRVFQAAMSDPRCAKIVLTRNVVDSYVSRKIAWATDQWRLGDMKNAVKAKVNFDPEEFEKLLGRLKGFQLQILQGLQKSGQTAFYVDYDDIQDLDVINGIGRFLGVEKPLEALSGAFKKQNPERVADKVKNFDVLEKAIAKIDHFDLGRIPNFEPRRGPIIPTYCTAAKAPVIFMPVPGGPDQRVRTWLAALDGVAVEDLAQGYTQKSLRQWKRKNDGHRSFTVLRHPVARLHAAFCAHFLGDGPDVYSKIRKYLREAHGLPLPDAGQEAGYDMASHRAAFLGFTEFVKGNLSGQTSIRVDGSWASQAHLIQGFGQFMLPDHILREDDLATGLENLAQEVGVSAPSLAPKATDGPFTLDEFYDDEVEAAVRAAYQRDYMMFGFGAWR